MALKEYREINSNLVTFCRKYENGVCWSKVQTIELRENTCERGGIVSGSV